MSEVDGDYTLGSVKRDPVTQAVAVRTNQPLVHPNPMMGSQAWNIAAPLGSYLKGPDVVADWLDIPDVILDNLPLVIAKLPEIAALLGVASVEN